MRSHQTLPKLTVVRDYEVKQFVDDYVFANVAVQAQQLSVEV